MEKRRVVLVMTEEALGLLAQLTTERKRGEFLSQLVVEHVKRQPQVSPTGILERIEESLQRIEARLEEDRQALQSRTAQRSLTTQRS